MTDGIRPGRWFGAVSGLIAAAAAMGIAQLVAGLTTPQASPVVAVGQAVIGGTPRPVKDWATSTFGTNDKTVLVGGVLVILFAFAALIGVLATRRLRYGMAGLIVFAAIGLAAVLSRPNATTSWIWPTLIGAAAGAIALSLLIRAVPQPVAEAPRIIFGSGSPTPASAWTSGTADTDGTGEPETDEDATASGDARGSAGGGAPLGSRRAFIATAGVTLVAAAAGEYGGRMLATNKNVTTARSAVRFPRAAVLAPPLPAGINPKVAGITQFVTPDSQFYRVDTAIIVPEVDPAGWTLRIHGMVRREITLSYAELLRRPLTEDWLTLCCVSNPVGGPYIGNAKWLGAPLAALLREAGPLAGADQLLCTSADGFTSGTPLTVVMDGRDAMVAVAMNGAALPVEHGFPARLVVPGLYGYVSACKWVTSIEVTTFAKASAYWVQNGWAQQGPIKTESRIDVPSAGATVGPGPVMVAGVAWAQHKGIAAVEVQVDGQPWQQATLAAVPGIDTWRQWTWEWKSPTPGNHVLQARATDETGYTQTSIAADVAPNGASGYPSAAVTVRNS